MIQGSKQQYDMFTNVDATVLLLVRVPPLPHQAWMAED